LYDWKFWNVRRESSMHFPRKRWTWLLDALSTSKPVVTRILVMYWWGTTHCLSSVSASEYSSFDVSPITARSSEFAPWAVIVSKGLRRGDVWKLQTHSSKTNILWIKSYVSTSDIFDYVCVLYVEGNTSVGKWPVQGTTCSLTSWNDRFTPLLKVRTLASTFILDYDFTSMDVSPQLE
jgi:hypothetical protein